MSIRIRPSKLRQFGDPRGATFCVITDAELAEHLVIDEASGYADCRVLVARDIDDFDRMLTHDIPRRAHVLVMSPNVFFRSPRPAILGPERKLLGMACNSTPTSASTIEHFLGVMEDTDAQAQQAFAEAFFDRGRTAEQLAFIDERWGTRATFDHLDETYEWNQQAGPLEWGEQQISPSGELSVLPMEILQLDETKSLQINGQIALRGYPILHSGTGPFERSDQVRKHAELATMRDQAVIAHVEHGVVTKLEATGPSAEPARRTLQAMFDSDARYRLLWEVGFAINTSLRLLEGNHAMNEVFGGTQGAIHWGFGLTPYTQYHLDIISPGTTVADEHGRLVFGGACSA